MVDRPVFVTGGVDDVLGDAASVHNLDAVCRSRSSLELRGCVQVDVAVLSSASLIVRMVSGDVMQN